ncbi:MAG: DUF1501 domain-containing protein [Planctomycetaceae bacterium]
MNHQITRRTVLQTAAGFGLSFSLPGLDLRAARKRGIEREKSLIVLWMNGGPSQLETWDPHPGSGTGGQVKAIRTTVPGLQICSMYPQMAEQIGELNVIRSLVSKEGDHERGAYYVKTGFRPIPTVQHPALSAVVTRENPVDADEVQIPGHVSLCGGPFPARGGSLGSEYDAFRVFNPGQQLTDSKARVDASRQQRRLDTLDVVSRAFSKGRRVQTERTLHQLTVERAITMMSSEQLSAFRLDSEPEALKLAYGDTRFGRGCLVARRLVENGVRAIEVNLNGWDTHISNHEGCQTQASQADPALATLISDLKQRDLLDSTIVLCVGEFGRDPRMNSAGGRDHWPHWFSCIVGGGGFHKGLVIGETDPDGGPENPKKIRPQPADPVTVPDLYATIYALLGIDHTESFTYKNRPVHYSDGTPLERLVADV